MQLDYHNRKEAGKGDGHCPAFMFGMLEHKQTQLYNLGEKPEQWPQDSYSISISMQHML